MTSETQKAARKALIVEAPPIVSDSLYRLITDTFENILCIHATTGAKGLSYLNGNHFDIILLDINLPDMSGIEFCSTARTWYPDLKILAVTSLAQRYIVEKMIQAGVNGFVLKTSDIKDITEGIKQVMEGGSYFGKGVKELMTSRFSKDSSVPMVTRRESEILKLIAEGLTNQEIAEKLYISTSTVDSHRKHLLLKFDVKNSAALVKSAMGKGLI